MLLVLSYFDLPIPFAEGPQSEGIQYRVSFGPPQNSNDDKYTLTGTVVNSATGGPIRGALVQVYFNGQSSILTGSDGKFQFDGLPAGQSSINVRKPGFFSEIDIQPSAFHQRMVATGPGSSPVVVKLIPEGVIYGRISSEDGEPIAGLPVALLEQSLQNGRKSWQQRPGAQTDEDGNFRIAELPPGNYFLSSGPGRDPVTFPAKLSQPGAQGIPVVYYPAGTDLSAAAPISVAPGQKIEINLTIPPQPFYRISGAISGYPPGQSVSLQLRNPVGMFLPYNLHFDTATGAFHILWVPAGAYTLQADSLDAHGHALIATVPLTVNSELSGIHVVLLPTVNIPIRMSVITSRTGAERFSQQENYFPAYVQLVAHSSSMFERRYGSQQVGERGSASLELQNIVPGSYTVEINANGPLYVQSLCLAPWIYWNPTCQLRRAPRLSRLRLPCAMT